MLYHIVAMSRNRVIGKNGKLPWHFSSDLKHFKELTMGSTVITGRKTFESIGKPLPGRENFVVSRKPDGARPLSTSGLGKGPGPFWFSSFDSALGAVKTPHAFVIGGAELYRQTIDKVDGIYLTLIDADYDGDAFYLEIPAAFKEKSRKLLQENPKIEVVFYEKSDRART